MKQSSVTDTKWQNKTLSRRKDMEHLRVVEYFVLTVLSLFKVRPRKKSFVSGDPTDPSKSLPTLKFLDLPDCTEKNLGFPTVKTACFYHIRLLRYFCLKILFLNHYIITYNTAFHVRSKMTKLRLSKTIQEANRIFGWSSSKIHFLF